MSEEKKKEAKKVQKTNNEKKNTKTNKAKGTEKEKIVVTKPGGGISMKNWIFIVIGGFILFFAGLYFGKLSTQGTIKNYETQIEQLQQKQNLIQEVLDVNY